MTKKKKLLYAFCLLAALLLAAGALIYSQMQRFAAPKTVIYIPKNLDQNNDFWTTLIAGVEMASEEYNLELKIMSPDNETDIDTQNRLLREAAAHKPDILAVSPISYTESTDLIKEIESSGILVVLIDSRLSEEVGSTCIATDNYKAGLLLGDYMAKLAGPNAKIAIVSHVKDSSTAMERENGLKDGLSDINAEILDTVYCDSDFQKSHELTTQLLLQHPDITMIAGLNEYSAVGAGRAVRDLGLKDKVTVVGFDSSIPAIQLMEEGVFKGMVVQKAFNMGYLGIETAYQIKMGQSSPYFVDTGAELIRPEDMYTTKGQKLLFSFLEN